MSDNSKRAADTLEDYDDIDQEQYDSQVQQQSKRGRSGQSGPAKFQKRRIQNRESARRYRQRQKQQKEELQSKVQVVQRDLEKLKMEQAHMKGELHCINNFSSSIGEEIEQQRRVNEQCLVKVWALTQQYPVIKDMLVYYFGPDSNTTLERMVADKLSRKSTHKTNSIGDVSLSQLNEPGMHRDPTSLMNEIASIQSVILNRVDGSAACGSTFARTSSAPTIPPF